MSASTTTKQTQQPVKPKRRRFKETTITTAATSSTDGYVQDHSFASSFSKFNTALTAGLLNPMSQPPPQLDNKTRSSPTLFEMMSNDASNGEFLAQSQQRSDLATSINGVVSSQFDRQGSNVSFVSNGAVPPQNHHRSNQSTALVPNGVISSHNEKRSDRSPTLELNGFTHPQNHQTSDFLVNSHGEAKQALIQQRLSEILAVEASPGSCFNDSDSGDLKLTLSSKDGVSVDISVHKQILVAHSRFFESKLSENWTMKQEASKTPVMEIEIADCDDVEVYVETLRLMYCKDLRRRLMKEDVDRVLGILKTSAGIGFDAGILSCLEYLEAVPWSEDEEVSSLLSQLQLKGIGAEEVLRRISHQSTSDSSASNNEEVLLKLLQAVLEGKDEKARRDMKALIAKMLRENSSQNDLRKESLYIACNNCLKSLRYHFLKVANESSQNADQIAKQADNLHWLLDILIDRQIAEDFLSTWASLSELSKAHCKVPVMHRFEISRITARFFIAIGKRQMLASKAARCMLLETWLVPFYEDFAWMKRASKGLDRNLIEEGLSNTISTLPLNLQQEILMSWFDRYLNSGEDCPNIQRGFEVWWRRALSKRSGEGDSTNQMRIVRVETSKLGLEGDDRLK